MYKVGDEISYGLHGKCVVASIETKELDTQSISFYRVFAVKNPMIPRSPVNHGPSIFIPVATAESKGMRRLMTRADAEKALKDLADPTITLELSDHWVNQQKALEELIRREGASGLTKVVGHLYLKIKQDAVPQSAITKFYDLVYRIFLREVAEAMELASKDLEPQIARALKHKLEF